MVETPTALNTEDITCNSIYRERRRLYNKRSNEEEYVRVAAN